MILKNPSWQTLFPGLPAYHPLAPEQSYQLQQLTNLFGIVYQVRFNDLPSNFYMIDDYRNKKKYFVKEMEERHVDHYKQAEEIAAWLFDRKVNVNAALDLKHHYYIYSLLEGIRIPSTAESLNRLGTALAALHSALKVYPWQEEIQTNTVRRISLLNEIREDITRGKLAIGPFPDYIKKLAQNRDLDFTQGASAQVLHGDLHPGNMLLVNDSIYFFDFEDVLYSYLPLVYELAYILERQVFVCHSAPNEILNLGRTFMKAYLANGGSYQFQKSDSYASLTLALRSLCVLTLCEIEGNRIHEGEWFKFRDLAELAQKNQGLLREILQG
ncbi:phosphotransferase [Legionella clemsonensis]|uniref:Serine/threonine protein kinase n=1 Tax=Legionella clemsonensis TaxID=1867846 RepID=A0A222P3S6_9GAMM|nr:phosphotransferase [Legionella clemsonensis]ASQ46425.1 serine/threonine protein kinase [Legionella clemsonensis]